MSWRLAAALLLAAAPAPVPAREPCAMDPADRAWLEESLGNWREAERAYLLLGPRRLPEIAAPDARCTWLLPRGRVERARGSPHDGERVVLPDGYARPLGPMSFGRSRAGYFAMSLPSVWRAAGMTSELGLERLMAGVLLHELAHSRHAALLDRLVGPLAVAAGLGGQEMSDNVIEDRFGGDPDYAAAWRRERDLLYAAAAAPGEAEARGLARDALAAMRARRDRWFAGDKAPFRELDDVFLTAEGVGQWVSYRYFLSPAGGALAPDFVLRAMRHDAPHWSEDEGLALILTVDRLLPGWQKRAFRDPDWRAERLLAAAVEGGAGR